MINYDLTRIRLLAFDVDGVLSASTVPMGMDGVPMRTANIKDGYAIHHAVRQGLPVAIITGGTNEAVRRRYESLGCSEIFLGCSSKAEVYESLLARHSLRPENVLYMGDDIPDLPVMRLCGVPCCPKDAAPEIQQASIYISHLRGGCGCARDVIEQVLKAQGKWLSDSDACTW